MDGNGRWAERRGRPRPSGHRAGARAVRRVVESAPSLGITDLTLYAFSSDNWARPAGEVAGLMRLVREYLGRETRRCVAEGVRLTVIGRRDRLSPSLRRAIAQAEAATSAGTRLRLRLALDYSARDALVGAANRLAARGYATREGMARALAAELGADELVPDVDLLIRTGGEQRLSDFLLWECAYAELYFTPVLWPDFGALELIAALAEYGARDRRFGRVAAGPEPGDRPADPCRLSPRTAPAGASPAAAGVGRATSTAGAGAGRPGAAGAAVSGAVCPGVSVRATAREVGA